MDDPLALSNRWLGGREQQGWEHREQSGADE
jgi:hypothetical protein